MVVEREAERRLAARVGQLGARACRSATRTRQAMFDAMVASGAVFGGGPSGRFWFAGDPPTPDALLALSLLLDRPQPVGPRRFPKSSTRRDAPVYK